MLRNSLYTRPINQRHTNDDQFQAGLIRKTAQLLFRFELGESVWVGRARRVVRRKRRSAAAGLPMKLYRTEENEPRSTCRNCSTRQIEGQLDVNLAKFGKRVRGRLIHYMNPSSAMHHGIHTSLSEPTAKCDCAMAPPV